MRFPIPERQLRLGDTISVLGTLVGGVLGGLAFGLHV